MVGGAGFIGSTLLGRLLAEERVDRVVVLDNLSSGSREMLGESLGDSRVDLIVGDCGDPEVSSRALEGVDVVVHLASNPDIARAVTEPEIDFSSGTLLTNSVVEAARTQGVNTIVYASGSGVYGDLGDLEIPEDHGPLRPVSTYGASKLAGEALVCAYAHMFGLRGRAFRFANVVGPRQTHGVGYDFLNKLAGDPTRLEILGDGRQSKCYIAIADVLDAILGVIDEPGDLPYEVFNVSTDDALSVDEIAAAACRASGLDPAAVVFDHTGGRGGWNGDVPVVRLDTSRIRSRGWAPKRSSAAAMEWALASMADALTDGADGDRPGG
ncbi:MAG: NAD-dependent epimerase/dehydratase family protein [Candidatus Microthrix sp.]|nr:NAD-dependent epimerase/dehydratase family protein [Candidatus Microthrix sp.]